MLGDCRANLHHRAEFPTRPERGFRPTFAELCPNPERTRARAARDHRQAAAISVSVGGPVDVLRGVVRSPPNLPGWDDVPLKNLLERRCGLPAHIEHDGKAAALAEWSFGAARACRNVVFLTMGTGFGGGLILNGQLYRGSSDLAGQVGHIRLAPAGPATPTPKACCARPDTTSVAGWQSCSTC